MTKSCTVYLNLFLSFFKGQSHEKFGEMRVEGDSIALTKSSYYFLKFSDRPFNSCEFSKFSFCLIEPPLSWKGLAPPWIPI
jgi:hypothetical protein